jgi:formate hydrogenlyase subunit 3/multisubunit Na+/H+ antiporter MnhD subunit
LTPASIQAQKTPQPTSMSLLLVLLASALLILSGVPGMLRPARAWLGEAGALLGCAAGLAGAGLALAGHGARFSVPLPTPVGSVGLALDALSAFFLVSLFLVGGAGILYARSYWPDSDHPESAPRLRFFYGLMCGGMAFMLVARHALPFLVGWETMALAGFFAITAEDRDENVRRAGSLYLFCTKVGTLLLMAMFAAWGARSGSLDLAPVQGGAPLVLLLALLGFGFKAGLMPLHVWLPSAHAAAPSHVSAFLSGVVIKAGIYGIVRMFSLVEQTEPAWGTALLTLGAISAVLGVAFAIGQHDIKRLLAYHSIENIGIILMGLGIGLLGRAVGRLDLLALGLAGALLHTWNHGLFKSLLFLSAGAVIHGTHERDIDRLGGLLKRMPSTALAFIVGAVAICGLPPLNGFVSEFLVYSGLLHTVAGTGGRLWLIGAAGAPALALTGGLALLCFTKVVGVVFLGEPRTPAAAQAHDTPRGMLAAMALLGACCVAIGLGAGLLPWVLDPALAAFQGTASSPRSLGALAPLAMISAGGLLLALLLALGAGLLRARLRAMPVHETGTWDCGYAAPTVRMQYTASSFAETVVELFSWALRPDTHSPGIKGLFPARPRFHSHVPDVVLDRVVLPLARAIVAAALRIRGLQREGLHAAILYVLLALLAAFVVSPGYLP